MLRRGVFKVVTSIFLALGSETVLAAQRQVEIQWEETTDAEVFEVEIRNLSGRIVKKFTSKSSLLKFRAPVGSFQVRARVVTKNGIRGSWSDWDELQIPPKSISWDLSQSSPQRLVETTWGRDQAQVNLAWPVEPTATSYLVKVFDSNGKVIHQEVTKTAKLKVEVPPGDYTFSVTTRGPQDFASEEVTSPEKITVTEPVPPAIVFKDQRDPESGIRVISWRPHASYGVRLKLESKKFLGTIWTTIDERLLVYPLGSWSASTNLPPGEYRATLQQEKTGRLSGSPYTNEFLVKPSEQVLDDSTEKLRLLANE